MAKTLEVERLEKKAEEAEEYQQHMEQEQSDGQVLVANDHLESFQGVPHFIKETYSKSYLLFQSKLLLAALPLLFTVLESHGAVMVRVSGKANQGAVMVRVGGKADFVVNCVCEVNFTT